MKRLFLVLLFLGLYAASAQQRLNIIPQPREFTLGEGLAHINRNTHIILDGSGLEKQAAYLNAYLQKQFGFRLPIRNKSEGKHEIHLNYERLDYPLKGAYTLSVELNGIFISGDNEEGVFYGIQTLIQLLPVHKAPILEIPFVYINDSPRFEYRGMHLDVARHVFPVDFIKRYIDFLALHKLNVFHWHLSDDQGWRLEIKKYPKLTQVGAQRYGTIIGRYPGNGSDELPYGGYYTQKQVKEIVQYAADRYIMVIPEIELPGHSSAAIAAYPELSCFPSEPTIIPSGMASRESKMKQEAGQVKLVQETWGVFEDVLCPTEYSFNFLNDLLDEVAALFPSPYIHIGGDECPKQAWKRSAFCQQLIREKGLKDEFALQAYFINRIAQYLKKKGKTVIGWNEILEGGLTGDAVIMSWSSDSGGMDAIQANHKVIMTPQNPLYFDHTQSKNEDSVTFGGYNPIEKVYDYDPVPKGLEKEKAAMILGAQANVWTEYITNESRITYMIFPRMAALSEVLWSPVEKKNYADFEIRLKQQFNRYDFWKVNYSKAYYELDMSVIPGNTEGSVMFKLQTKFKDARVEVYRDGIKVADRYIDPVPISASGLYNATLTANDKVLNNVNQSFQFNKLTAKKISLVNPASKSYPGDGAFTLVNAVQNKTGFARSNEFLGFSGTDMDATIDLGKETSISTIRVHTLHLPASWIYLPKQIKVSFLSSLDSSVNNQLQGMETIIYQVKDELPVQEIRLPESKQCRYLRIVARNFGTIPMGNPGAGEKAWLFVDELEAE